MDQFIEKIFPSQKQLTPKTREALEKERQRMTEERWEVFFVALAVLAAIAVCGLSMVRSARSKGSRRTLISTVVYCLDVRRQVRHCFGRATEGTPNATKKSGIGPKHC
jgi:hypothetical protein